MKNSILTRLVNLERASVQTLQNYPPLTDEQLQAVIDGNLSFGEPLDPAAMSRMFNNRSIDELSDNELAIIVYGWLSKISGVIS
ncbi:hypothetical protein [Methylocucumis oryzae]|uniref:Uncharacterized protein n=1 Tax=Methylocucumis oryzae TaxID=1632867 RepID=A0A0F3IIE7_9GAMM|nr:hypothetical protein [Methylocucumis oryzae]KJV05239.1 hypothetical protein VZ94_19620 [Methylocucumis oryzae]